MNKYFGFGKETIQMHKLWAILQDPSSFYQKNKDDEEQLLHFMIFIIRASAVIAFLSNYIYDPTKLNYNLIVLGLTFVFAKIIAWLSLVIYSAIQNFFVKIFSGKSDIIAAKRVVAYTSIFSLFPSHYFLEALFIILVSIIFTGIAISKQYKISLKLSLFIAVFPTLIVLVVIIIFLAFQYNSGAITLDYDVIKSVLWV